MGEDKQSERKTEELEEIKDLKAEIEEMKEEKRALSLKCDDLDAENYDLREELEKLKKTIAR